MESSTKQRVRNYGTKNTGFKRKILAGMVAVSCFTLFSCQKEMAATPDRADISMLKGGNVLGMYSGLPATTMWELQQARATSAKYQRLENALRDGYVDINVVIPGMGRHYMKESLVDDVFDPRLPEILVYNTVDGQANVLVAVEYGYPIALSPDHQPDGFTGDHDHWAKNVRVGMWLLHAWVWKYNPDGVFAHTNQDVP